MRDNLTKTTKPTTIQTGRCIMVNFIVPIAAGGLYCPQSTNNKPKHLEVYYQTNSNKLEGH